MTKNQKIDAIQKELLNLGYSAIQPMLHPISAPCIVDGKWILVIWVSGGEVRPYKAKKSLSKESQDWAYYIRRHSSTVQTKGADEQELISLAANIPFDDRCNMQASIDDLSQDLIEEFLQEVGSNLVDEVRLLSPEAMGQQMNIVAGPKEAVFPKNVGLLFFCDDPRQFFPVTQIDVVWFPDGAGGDRFEEKIFSGPLARMTREALNYIQRNYLKEIVIKHPDRAEAERVWNFPYAAVEEALVNAVYHRSYEIREPIEVRITSTDLVVLSFPGPDRSIRMEELRVGRAVSRRYRNRRLGDFLKELELTEGRSTGIPKIIRNMQDNGSPAPEFETDDDRLSYLVRLPVHPKVESNAEESTGSVTQSVTQSDEVSKRLLLVLESGEMSPKELRLKLNISHRTFFRNNYLTPALEEGLIEPAIPDKPTSRLQKYRLTPKGQSFLESLEEMGEKKEKTTVETTGDFGTILERVRNNFGSSVAKVFEIICQHPDYSAEDIATELGKTPRTVENYIAKLKQGDVILRKGPKLGGHWEVIDE